MGKRQPDYDVNALNKSTDERARIGAAWKNSDGSISIILNHFVQITASKELLITLFPKERGTENKEPF